MVQKNTIIRSHPEYQYLDLMRDIMDHGQWKVSHSTGVKLKSVFGRMCRYDLSKGFPLLTTKKVFSRGIIHELLWFISGSSNIKYLIDNNVHIWDEWAYKKYAWAVDAKKATRLTYEQFLEKIQTDKSFLKSWGELGPVYGVQWRKWPAYAEATAGKPVSRKRTVDQLGWAIEKIKKYPTIHKQLTALIACISPLLTQPLTLIPFSRTIHDLPASFLESLIAIEDIIIHISFWSQHEVMV